MSQTILTQKAHEGAGERSEYRLYALVAYPFFLAAAAIGRLAPIRRRGPKLSVFAEASEGVKSVIPWVFMGR